jgi:hypothetical protein
MPHKNEKWPAKNRKVIGNNKPLQPCDLVVVQDTSDWKENHKSLISSKVKLTSSVKK